MILLLLLQSLALVSPSSFHGYDFVSQKEVSQSLVNDTYTVIYFLNATCPCSDAHLPYLEQLKQSYPEYTFVGFEANKETTRLQAQEYFSKYKLSFPIFEDTDLNMADHFRAVKTPHVFVLNDKGEIIYQGGATNSKDPKQAKQFYLKDVLEAIKQKQELPFTVTRTLGCYIER